MSTLPDFITESPDDYAPDGELAHDWIDSDRRAEWALRRLCSIRARHAELTEQRDAWIAEVYDWWTATDGPIENECERLTAALERYALVARERDDRKTVTLPSGTLRTRDGGDPVVSIVDAKAVLAWALEDAERAAAVVKVDQKVLVAELRRIASIRTTEDGDRYVTTHDGELIPGVCIVEPETTAHIAPATP